MNRFVRNIGQDVITRYEGEEDFNNRELIELMSFIHLNNWKTPLKVKLIRHL